MKKSARRKQKNKQATKSQPTPADPPLPSRLAMEQMMAQMSGMFHQTDEDDPTYEAQQMAYSANEAAEGGDLDSALDLANQALELDPGCVDALMLFAQAESQSEEEIIAKMRQTVETGERALGESFFKENTGHFWGLIETRPYMRARAFLAECLVEAEQLDEAIEHYEALLSLNPGDNQGIRSRLIGLYLATNRLDGASRLFTQYDDEGSAMFAWAKVLERFMVADKPGARKALKEARDVNPYVEAFLKGRKRLPKTLPDFYSFGDENEAIMCLHEIGLAWVSTREALDWLCQQK